MSVFVAPQDNPAAWSSVIIEGTPTPGLLAGPPVFTVSRKIDEKPSPGSDSFALTDKGAQCSDVEITIRLVEPSDYAAYQRLYEKHMDPRRPLTKRNVVTVVHPALHSKGIRQLYFFSADSPKTGEGVGVTLCKMVGKEYNAKTRIGAGSSKPKPAQFNAGALDSNNLNGRQPFRVVPTSSGAAAADTVPANLRREALPQSRTVSEWRTAASKGDPQAQHVVATLDARATAAKGG